VLLEGYVKSEKKGKGAKKEYEKRTEEREREYKKKKNRTNYRMRRGKEYLSDAVKKEPTSSQTGRV